MSLSPRVAVMLWLHMRNLVQKYLATCHKAAHDKSPCVHCVGKWSFAYMLACIYFMLLHLIFSLNSSFNTVNILCFPGSCQTYTDIWYFNLCFLFSDDRSIPPLPIKVQEGNALALAHSPGDASCAQTSQSICYFDQFIGPMMTDQYFPPKKQSTEAEARRGLSVDKPLQCSFKSLLMNTPGLLDSTCIYYVIIIQWGVLKLSHVYANTQQPTCVCVCMHSEKSELCAGHVLHTDKRRQHGVLWKGNMFNGLQLCPRLTQKESILVRVPNIQEEHRSLPI